MIVNSTPIYGYDFTNYNSGTGIWQSGLIPAPLPNGNVRCGTLTTTGGILPGGYSPTALYFLFFVSGVGGGFGLANSYANALAKIPVIFTTGGTGTIVFRESGGYYNLQAKVPECCDEPYFNQQFPSFDYPDNENFFPDKVPSSVTITPSLVRSSGALYSSNAGFRGWRESEVIAAIALMNAPVTLYLTTADNYDNSKSPSCQFNQVITTADFYVTYNFVISNTVFGLTISVWLRSRNIYFYIQFGGTIPSVSFTLVFTSYFDESLQLVDSVSNPVISFGAPLTSMVLPSTLTLTKKPATYLHTLPDVIASNAPYPTRGWTTNDYTSELPNSITLTKVAGYNNYEGEFTTAVNVKNYVRLKLVGSGARGWKYADYEMFSSYLGSSSKYLPSTDFNFSGYTTPVDWAPHNEPTEVIRHPDFYGYTNLYLQEVSLFRMEGIPLLTSSGYVVSKCKGFANYYLENPGYSPTPPPS
jgi:hypothetical protein